MEDKNPIVNFVVIMLRGVGQCVLSGSPVSGAIFIVGIAYSSWQAALWMLAGGAAATIIAKLFGAPKLLIDIGMFGFGGSFVGVLVGTFFMIHVPAAPGELAALFILGTIFSVPVVLALTILFAKMGLSSTALPVVTVVWLLIAGFLHSNAVDHSLPDPAPAAAKAAPETPAPYTWETWVYGTLSAFGQPVMHGNLVTGGFILAGILYNSRIMGLMGVLGALLSITVSWWLGVPVAGVGDGAMSFNSVMTAMALPGFFLYFDYRSVIYGLAGSLLAMWAHVAAAVTLAYIHLPDMVVGFAAVTTIMVLGAQGLSGLKVVPLEKISKPEESFLKDLPAES